MTFVDTPISLEFDEYVTPLIQRAIDFSSRRILLQDLDRNTLRINEEFVLLPCNVDLLIHPVNAAGVYAKCGRDLFIPLRPSTIETSILRRFGEPVSFELQWWYHRVDNQLSIVGNLRVVVQDAGWLEIAQGQMHAIRPTLMWHDIGEEMRCQNSTNGWTWTFSVAVESDDSAAERQFEFHNLPFQTDASPMVLRAVFSVTASSIAVVSGPDKADCLALDEVDGRPVELEIEFSDMHAWLPAAMGRALWPGVNCDVVCTRTRVPGNVWKLRTTEPVDLKLPGSATPRWLTSESPQLDIVRSRAVPLTWSILPIGSIPDALFFAVASSEAGNNTRVADSSRPNATTPQTRLSINPNTGNLDEFTRSKGTRVHSTPAMEVTSSFHVLGAVREKVRWGVTMPSESSGTRDWMSRAEHPLLVVPRKATPQTDAWGGVWRATTYDVSAVAPVLDWEQSGRTFTLRAAASATELVVHMRGLLMGLRKESHDRVTVWLVKDPGILLANLTALHKSLLPFDIEFGVDKLRYTELRSRNCVSLPTVVRSGNKYTLGVNAAIRAFTSRTFSTAQLAGIRTVDENNDEFGLDNPNHEPLWFALADPLDAHCGVLLSYDPSDATWRFRGVVAFDGASAAICSEQGVVFRIGTGVGRFFVHYLDDSIVARSPNCPENFKTIDSATLSAFSNSATLADYPGIRRLEKIRTGQGNAGRFEFVAVDAPVPELGFHVWEQPADSQIAP